MENNNEELVKMLLANGSKTETLSYGRLTAYQLAYDTNNIMKHLETYGCQLLSPPESDFDDSDASDEFD